MPNVNDQFANLEAMTAGELEMRRSELVRKAAGKKVDDMELDDLRELSAITAQLRRKTAGPPKSEAAKKAKKNGPQKKASVDDIFSQI